MSLPVAPKQRPALAAGLRGRLQSFRFAIRGIGVMVRSQKNAWIHAVLTILVVGFGVAAHLSWAEWCSIVLSIVAVWTAEALNTAFEFLADVASPEFHPLVEKAKDVAAGAVASALRARRLVYLCDVPGLLSDPGNPESLLSTLKVNDVAELKARKVITSGMLPKVDSAVKALDEGVHRVHFVDGRKQHSTLLEIFTDKGIGTEIVNG